MPTYRLFCMMRPDLLRSEVVSVVRKVSSVILDNSGIIQDFQSFGVNPLEQRIKKTHGHYRQAYMVEWRYFSNPDIVRETQSYMLVDERVLRFMSVNLNVAYLPSYETLYQDYNLCPALHPAFNPTVQEYLTRKGLEHEMDNLRAKGLMMDLDEHKGLFVQFANLPRAVTEDQLLRWLGDGKDSIAKGTLFIRGEKGYNVAYVKTNSEMGQDRILMNYDKERVMNELQEQAQETDDIQLQDDLLDRTLLVQPCSRIFLPVGLQLPPDWIEESKQLDSE
eukprot:TRINITY_DN3846_c0_g1_i2.p3 TRINITY_DN3846_c0_g1~~TRINITY_DN3846_c0_g1_i2.p3  ORF type:complete len:278 (-),score=22.62 TRINITY_DN3846_c0_g1_i2:1416-2249(-)